MPLILIAAMSENRVIGYQNTIPWHIKGEQLFFRQLTLGKPVIMGRKTFESIGRPLPDRINIIVTRNPDFRQPDCIAMHSIDAAIELAEQYGDTAFIIGGGEIFQQTILRADAIYLTIIHARIEGDVFFPELPDSLFVKTEQHFVKAEINYTRYFYKRNRN
ncbi:dihydrofolate reductase [candidate division KSB1 bacterium]|nr:dihydrofolate reductase [candidate division KSB1 bacterium]